MLIIIQDNKYYKILNRIRVTFESFCAPTDKT